MSKTKAKTGEMLKEFLMDIQRGKDEVKKKEGVLTGDEMERKNILNLKIVCCVDVSASISSEQYNSFMNQVRMVKGLSRVQVIETDTEISCMYNLDLAERRGDEVVRLRGGGGTDFEIAFKAACEMKPDAILFLTDGDDSGSLKKPKDIPVAWCVTNNGHAPYTWGKEIGRVDT